MQGEVTLLRMILEYYGNKLWICALLATVVFLLIVVNKKSKQIIFVAGALFCILIFNPVVINMLGQSDKMVFYRFLWIIPFPLLFAYVCTKLLSKSNRPIIVIIPIVIAVGIGVYTNNNAFGHFYTRYTGAYNLYTEAGPISDVIDEYSKDDKVYVVMPASLQMQIRLFNPKIVSAIPRSAQLNYALGKLDSVSGRNRGLIDLAGLSVEYSTKKMSKYIEDSKAEFVILPLYSDKEYMKEVGCDFLKSTDSFDIYKVGIDYELDKRGRVVVREYINGIWCKTENEMGYSRVEYTYNEHGKKSSIKYYMDNGQPALLDNGSSGWIKEYDNKDRLIKKMFTGVDGKPILLKKGFCSIEYKYDDAGKMISQTYYDEFEIPTESKKGVAYKEFIYDENGEKIETKKFNLQGEEID